MSSSTSPRSEPWRYRCPRGHTSWRPQGGGYYCRVCDEQDMGPVFDELQDVKK